MDLEAIFLTTVGVVLAIIMWTTLLAGWYDDRAKAWQENQTPDLLKGIP